MTKPLTRPHLKRGRKPGRNATVQFCLKITPALAKRLRKAKGEGSYPKLIERLLAESENKWLTRP